MTTDAYRDRIRQRLADRLTPTANQSEPVSRPRGLTTEDRILEAAEERHRALRRRAHELRLTCVPDPGHPGRYITREAVVMRPGFRFHLNGRCNLTTPNSCTCREFRIWGRCPCVALVCDVAVRRPRRLFEHIDERIAA